MSTIKVDKLQGTSGAVTGLTFSGANGTFGGTLAVTGVHTVGTNAVVTSEGGAVTTNIAQGVSKAWANFNGTGTVALNDSHNMASITDINVGNYRAVFTSAMSSTNYVYGGGVGDPDVLITGNTPVTTYAPLTVVAVTNAAKADKNNVMIAIHGDLA